jgi:hypothetical protein
VGTSCGKKLRGRKSNSEGPSESHGWQDGGDMKTEGNSDGISYIGEKGLITYNNAATVRSEGRKMKRGDGHHI